MRFPVHKRRGAPAVIIVALIDILIVLVIFLLVTTTFKQQPSLRLALPESTQAMKSGANETAPLVISVDDQGKLYVDRDVLPVTLDQLRIRLLSSLEKNRAEEKPELRLAISADKNAPFGKIVSVMDLAKEARIKTVNAFTKEPGKP